MTNTLSLPIHIVILAFLTHGCYSVEYRETMKNTPSDSNQALLGEWRSAGPTSFPTPQTCANLKWNVTSQDATHLAGTFEATCAGDVTLSGTASGVLDGNLKFDAVGTATRPGLPACPFTLSGTGILQIDGSLRVEYIGSTCVGTISGEEVLRR